MSESNGAPSDLPKTDSDSAPERIVTSEYQAGHRPEPHQRANLEHERRNARKRLAELDALLAAEDEQPATPQVVERAKALLAEATPGPWRAIGGDSTDDFNVYIPERQTRCAIPL